MFQAYITNLGKYNEGSLIGKWLNFPTTDEEIQETLKEIGIDGVEYEEFFITDYDSEIYGLTREFGEYENLRELNFLAERYEELDEGEKRVFESAIEIAGVNSAKDFINLTYNIDNYMLTPDVGNERELGEYIESEHGYGDMLDSITKQLPEHIRSYITFDAEQYAYDYCINNTCTFTDNGFIEQISCRNIEHYSGIEDLEPLTEDFSLTME